MQQVMVFHDPNKLNWRTPVLNKKLFQLEEQLHGLQLMVLSIHWTTLLMKMVSNQKVPIYQKFKFWDFVTSMQKRLFKEKLVQQNVILNLNFLSMLLIRFDFLLVCKSVKTLRWLQCTIATIFIKLVHRLKKNFFISIKSHFIYTKLMIVFFILNLIPNKAETHKCDNIA